MGLNFSHRIEFIAFERQGGLPGQVEVSKGKAWAAVKTLKGSEYNAAALAGSIFNTRFIVRYNKNIESHYQIKFKGKVYDIESMENDDEQNRTMTLFAKAVQ